MIRMLLFIASGCLALLTSAACLPANLYGNPTSVPSATGLVEALQAVMQNNPAVKGKRAELEDARFAVDTSKAGRYPTISVSADNLAQGLLDDVDEQGTLRVQQPLWAFGKIDAAIRESEADYKAEKLDLLQVQRQLLEDTAVAYARIDGVRKHVIVAIENIDEQEELYRRIQRRESGQLASEADVRLARSRLIQAKSQLLRLNGDIRVAQIELIALTQVHVKTDRPVEASLSQLPSDLEATALKNSAAIAYKRERLKVAEIGVRRENIDALPTIFLQVQHNFLDRPLNTDETSVGVTIIGSLEGMGFARRGRINSAAARLNAANEDIRVSIEDVRRRVGVLATNRMTQVVLMRSQKEAIQAVAETLESFIRQYEAGRKSWVEVLNTQRELTVLRFELAQIENDYLTLSLRLVALTGGLDEVAGITSL